RRPPGRHPSSIYTLPPPLPATLSLPESSVLLFGQCHKQSSNIFLLCLFRALKALWHFLGSKGINTNLIREKIKDIVIKTIIASEPYVNTLLKMHVKTPHSCHELFGFDIMLDENLKPWILEVNISPSLHSNSALDVSIKGQMIRDLLNLAGFRIPPREEVVSSCSSASSSTSSLHGGNKEKRKSDLSADEKVKRAFYLAQRYADQDFLSSVLDILTPEDVRVLAESEDELNRRGEFERIFPSHTSSRYLRFFECPRYLNILLDQWEQKHCNDRTKCISLLRLLCHKGIHLGSSDPAHMVRCSRARGHHNPVRLSRQDSCFLKEEEIEKRNKSLKHMITKVRFSVQLFDD
uniref:Tubulin tyrosine ligase-like family, member 4 n=1 Tax=Xiphophorus couchianus TaxID=32473 RepID=A0A3B5MMZ7_9TELE